MIIPVSDEHLEYARKLESELKASGVRAKVDDRSERMNQKIRQAQMDKVPCMLIVGEKEVTSGTVSVRLRSGEQCPAQPFIQFKEALLKSINDKTREVQIG